MALADVLDAAKALHAQVPALRTFAPWPDDLVHQPLEPNPAPAMAHLRQDPARAAAEAQAYVDAVKAAADRCDWRITYSQDEVGDAFVSRYAWFELVGPTGHYHSDALRVAFAYWGPHLTYPLHSHEAEEVYYVAAGRAAFWTDDQPAHWVEAGSHQTHASYEPHGFRTGDEGLLTLILWRGPGMGGRATLTTPCPHPTETGAQR
ncbi:MAG: dimethylsulfonioproprionate lyase family protein [Pseudomonadota bacterium]